MLGVIIFYGVQLILLIIIIIGSWLVWDKRFRNKHGKQVPEGFIRTNEVSIDPTTNKRLVVYFHPQSGERFYKEE